MNAIEILSKLEKVNFTNEQARTITEVLEDRQHDLATKSDVEAVTAKVESVKKELKAELKAEISKVKYDLVRWIVGALIFNVGLVASLMFVMFKLFLDK